MKTTGYFKGAIKILLLVVVALFMHTQVMAQEAAKTVIVLNSGEKVTGIVTEAVPDKYMKVQMPDGTVRTINATDIKEIQAAKEVNPQKSTFSFIAGIDASYDLTSKLGYVLVEPRVIASIHKQNNRYGMGISFIYGNGQNVTELDAQVRDIFPGPVAKKTVLFLPIFFNFRIEPTKKKIKPLIDFSFGYPVSLGKTTTAFAYKPSQYYDSYYEHVHEQIGIAYASLSPGVAFQIGKHSIGIAAKYSLLIFDDKYRLHYKSDGYVGTNKETSRNFRILNSLGLSVSFAL